MMICGLELEGGVGDGASGCCVWCHVVGELNEEQSRRRKTTAAAMQLQQGPGRTAFEGEKNGRATGQPEGCALAGGVAATASGFV